MLQIQEQKSLKSIACSVMGLKRRGLALRV